MKKTIIVGTMRSGKTYKMRELSKGYRDVYVYDPANSRNSDRDLANMGVGTLVYNLREFLKRAHDPATCLLVDEVHLFEVFHRQGEVEDIMLHTPVDTYLSGLLLDCYNGYRIFPIWGTVMGLATEVIYMKSRVPCKLCGKLDNVIYTCPDVQDGPRVGDAYYNVCYDCITRVR